MGFIEELYYGNLRADDMSFNRESQYAEALKVFCNNERKLSEVLSNEELKLFNDLVNASDEISAVGCKENFIFGFRLGVQMMCDSIFYKDDRIFREI